MKIRIDNTEVIVFRGATVSDAVRVYSKKLYADLVNGKIMVYDRFGNRIEPDGELTEGQIIHLKKNESL